ncbi:efflux RND transporter periplasmic adaptor subunit [Candidatus Wolfebacteria bacterium]|nr:efflux RND transporter periplasmic adaptor subunit [Candidatus Wolfebacteria bacterium]
MKKIKKFFKKPIVIIVTIFVLIGASYFIFGGSKKPDYEFITVQKADIIQEVSVTGRVKPAHDVNLAFENSGRVSKIFVGVSDSVVAGQTLIQLENAEIYAQLAQAQADLKTQQAKLEELKIGTREEEIKVQETKVVNARIALEEANKGLIDKIQDAYTKSDDAIRNKVDQFFKKPAIPNPEINFYLSNYQLKIDVEWQRSVSEDTLISWKSFLEELTLNDDLFFYANLTKENLNEIKTFLDDVSEALNEVKEGLSLTQTTIDGWRADIFTARTNINTALSNLLTAEEKIKTAESNFNLEIQELLLKKAGATNEQILAQEAQVEKAQANVLNYQAQISKTIIKSPIAGIVTKQETKVGEIIGANVNVVSVISVANFEIEANIPEADIAKVSIGNTAKSTLDAYGNDVEFEIIVVKIDPAETVIEGVATYKTTFQFINNDERVKSGMTANIDIVTDKKENVIVVPQRTIINKNGDKIVRILDGKEIVEVKVETGIRGSYGDIEIIKGINEGDKVITLLK